MKLFEEPAVYLRPDGVVRVTGQDRRAYLHAMLSQHVEGAAPGTVADFLYLDAKGNPLAAGRAVVHAEHVYLLVPDAAVAAEFAASLERYKFLMQVDATDRSADWRVASVRGEGAPTPGAPSRPLTAVPHGEGMVVRDRSGGADLLGPVAWVAERVAELSLPAATATEWDAWRISQGLPAWGSEITAGRRAQELGLLPTHVHLRKGCYPGQESIAKIYNLGRPRRALAVVDFDGIVTAGAAVEAAEPGAKAGEVTSAAPLGGGSVALALLPVAAPPKVRTTEGVVGTVRHRVGDGVPQPGA